MMLRFSAFLVAIFLTYLAWYWWDMRQLRAFCDDVRVGMPFTELHLVADRHGVDRRWLNGNGVFQEQTQLWSIFVTSSASGGSNVCAIRHDKKSVMSATIQID